MPTVENTTTYTNKTLFRGALAGTAVLAISLCNVRAFAFGTADDMKQSPLQAEFKRLDGNQDSRLSRAEAAQDEDISGNFDKADRDHNGMLVSEEYVTFKSAIQQKNMEEFLDDSAVTAKVKAELLKDAGMNGLKIRVETHKGKVILSGFVDNNQQLRRALQIASGVRGVKSVANGLQIKG